MQSTYPDRKPISTVWYANPNSLLFTATASDPRDFYWIAATYDRFDGRAWWQSDKQTVAVGVGEDALAGTSDALPEPDAGRLQVNTTVTNQDSSGNAISTLLAPSVPWLLDRTASVRTAGEAGSMAAIDFVEPVPVGQSYEVDSLVPDPDDQSVFTESVFAAAGEAYPASIGERYLDQSGNAVGAITRREARRILNQQKASERDPFHLADAIEDYLRSDDFEYQTDVTNVCRPGETVSDCLLEHKRGFCQYFATTMVLMLRELDVPARYVEGYLPGTLLEDGRREVTGAAAHAWVEVYFPDIGWWKFDPTPGSGSLEGQQPTSLPAGELGSGEPNSTAEPSFGPLEPEPTDPAEAVPPVGDDQTPRSQTDLLAAWGTPALLVLLTVLGAIVVAAAVWLRRRPALEPDAAFRGIVAVASRFGYGRQPDQTPYEYTASLSRVVPGVAVELQTVARAKVESSYARHTPGSETLAGLRRAYRRARLGLIRLFFRPPVED
jgi:transglutaminase-like putative cysteine protease